MSVTSAEFFDQWDTYHKVVANDYMFHRDIGAKVQQALDAHFGGRLFSFLDLGCGDATALAPILSRSTLSRYKGVDLSETALALAAKTLAALPCPVELARQDIIAALASEGSYDAIYSSFVLHHLPTEEKAVFFRRVADHLTPRGLLLLVDTVREEDESLEVYLRRYCDWIDADWPGLAIAEKRAICDHIQNNDMPEPYSVLTAQARAAGLAPLPVGVKHSWHRFICFARA